MTMIDMIAPGMQTTVQDLGRPGYGHLGVSACGAADALAVRIGNRLLGNPDNAAALEMTLLGGRFLLHGDARLVLTGADMDATLDGKPVPLWAPVKARTGATLAFAGTSEGARGYICIQGGIKVPPVLGSRSTHLPSRLGGVEGRALKSGDVLNIGKPTAAAATRTISAEALVRLRSPGDVLRITASAQTTAFPDTSRTRFASESWSVQLDSSRMGVRLAGQPLDAPLGGTMTTEGAPLGAIQVTPSGEPVILGVDHQTTGGYPKIACVISADRWRIGQLRPRAMVRFEWVSFDDARRLLLEQEERLEEVLPCR